MNNIFRSEIKNCIFNYNMESSKKEIYVPVYIYSKNRKKYELIRIDFILDTGANITCIDYDDASDLLNYSIEDYNFELLALATGFQGESAGFICLVPIRIETLSTGDFEFKNFLLYSGFKLSMKENTLKLVNNKFNINSKEGFSKFYEFIVRTDKISNKKFNVFKYFEVIPTYISNLLGLDILSHFNINIKKPIYKKDLINNLLSLTVIEEGKLILILDRRELDLVNLLADRDPEKYHKINLLEINE